MKIERAIELLKNSATAEDIVAAVHPMTIDSIEEKDLDFVVEALNQYRKHSTAIAPTTPSTAIAPAKRKSGNLTKAELQRRLEAAESQLAQAPVQQVHAHISGSNQVKDLVLNGIHSYVAESENAIDQGSSAIAQYNAAAPSRFWQAVEQKQQAIGIFDPTESIVQQQQANTVNLLDEINQIFEASDRALGIQGFTVEGQP